VTSATSESKDTDPEFSRRSGTDTLHGILYEMRTTAFLFVRALNNTEKFCLASNVDDLGAFDDVVFRFRLKDSEVWKTCLIQLKHKKNGGAIPHSELINMSGTFSLLKYFESYCEIKSKASTHHNLKHCGPFDDFEFVIYTNSRMGNNSAPQGEDFDLLSILSSGTDCEKYITFDESVDTKIFKFFKELAEYHNFLVDLNILFERGTFADTEIAQKIEKFQDSVTNKAILGKLNSLKSNLNKGYITRLIRELAKCDFNLYKEFLSKVKIFHSQSNRISLEGLIEEELSVACKASPSVVKSIYEKFDKGILEWWEKDEKVPWLSKKSKLWQGVVKHLMTEIKEISEPELQKFVTYGIRFNKEPIQRLGDAIKHNTLLNIVTNSNSHYLNKLKTYQALHKLGYRNSLFVSLNSLNMRRREIVKFWPCQWSGALVVDCDCDGNVADILLDILQESVGCKQGLETLVAVLQKYEQKVILISTGQHIHLAASVQEKLGNINAAYEDNCVLSDLDEKQVNRFLQRCIVQLQRCIVQQQRCIVQQQGCILQQFVVISRMVDRKLHFVHQCFADYFVAEWFADNFMKCEDFISNTLFNSTYKVTRNIFAQVL